MDPEAVVVQKVVLVGHRVGSNRLQALRDDASQSRSTRWKQGRGLTHPISFSHLR